MNEIKLKARAKINLSLDVTGKQPDGYHLLEMIMQSIELHDKIRIRKRKKPGIQLYHRGFFVPGDSRNIAYKAAAMMVEKFSLKQGIQMEIKKNIPVGAGLAGGSSDAAAVIVGINSLFELGLSQEQLQDMGLALGADIPFCIVGGSQLARGIGQELTPLPFVNLHLVVIKPRQSMSTKKVYGQLDINNLEQRPDTEKLIQALKNKDTLTIAKQMDNVLEPITLREISLISNIKSDLILQGAAGAMMSGSGSAVFGIFSSEEQSKIAYNQLKQKYKIIFLTQTSKSGIEIIR